MSRISRRPLLFVAVLLVIGGAAGVAGFVATRHAVASDPSQRAPRPPSILRLMSSDPAPGTQGVEPDATVTVQFSAPLQPRSPEPVLSPPVSGTWLKEGPEVLAFQPASGLPPGTQETVEVPGGRSGVAAEDGAHLTAGTSVSFSVAPMSMLRTQELLADLGYLPLTFTPDDPATPPPTQMSLDQAGSFAWKWTTMPAALTSLWTESQPNTITEGAIMAFEAQHGLTTDGDAGPQVWDALLAAASSGQADSDTDYDWVDVSTSVPQSLTVYRDGSSVYSTPVNTGIEGAATALGTWPVYARYTSTTMSGTNPDGSHYDDPGVPWVSYFHGGDALHGFDRASYGTPQSLGCVEMPPSNAAVVFPLTPLGTLVTVQ
jgi:lipoprotein-anchoring transpeptidase ErfK/SrfK